MRLSVVIPSFNQGAYLADAIRSVREHAPADTELIVMDGGSRDNSVDVLRSLQFQIDHWESHPDKGQSDALNRGFARSTGEIMAWLCADDLYISGGPARLVEWLHEHPSESWVYGDGRRIDVHGRILSGIEADDPDIRNLSNWCCVYTPACFWRQSLWKQSGSRIDQQLYYTMDWDLMLRFSRHAKPHHIPVPVTAIRDHALSKSVLARTDSSHQMERDREVVRVSRHYGGLWCYNSLAYPLVRIVRLRNSIPAHRRWAFAFAFAALHIPLRMLRWLYRHPKSNLG